MVYFKCIKCYKGFNAKCNLIRHIEGERCETVNTDVSHLSKEKIMEESIKKLDDNGEEINENKNFNCRICCKKFTTKQTQVRHEKYYCKTTEKKSSIQNDKNDILDDSNDNNVNSNNSKSNNTNNTINNFSNSNNTTNHNTTNNTTNSNNKIQNITNNNFNINLKVVRGFDEEWDISKIDKNTMLLLLLSDSKYFNTLEQIMLNDVNLNVLTNDGDIFTFNSLTQKFEKCEVEKIIKLSMDKLYNNLNEMIKKLLDHDDTTPKYMKETTPVKVILEGKKNIDEKYVNFNLSNEVKQYVSESFVKIFNENKDQTLKVHCQNGETTDIKTIYDGF